MPKKPNKANQDTNTDTSTVRPSEPATDRKIDADVVSDIESHVQELVEKYISELDHPEDIYDNNGLFVDMLKYIYRYYVIVLLNNGEYKDVLRYDYKVLNDLFSIYTSLVYRYKKNKQPYINEFCIFVNIDRTMLYRIRQGDIKKATSTDISNVKRWFQECEQGLLNTDSIGSIFRLKSMFNYNDNLAPVPIEMQNQVLNANQLPDLSAKSSEKLLADSQGSKPGNV